MAVTISEHYQVRVAVGENPGAEITYMAWGSFDDADIYAALSALPVPGTYRSIPLKDIIIEHQGGGVWECRAVYNFESGDDTTPAFSFDTTGGTAKITQAKATIGGYAASGYGVPNFGGAIGVTKDSIEGADILVPTYRWTETFFFSSATVDGAFKATIFALTGTYNASTFRGFQATEVLFEGVRGRKRGAGKWELIYHFAASPNVTGLTVGSITGIAKKGWEYLWVRYHDFDDTTGGFAVKRPVVVMIERVYDPGDMSLLGIGA